MARNIAEVTSGIEQRLAGWVAIQERQQVGTRLPPRPTITISREFGCEGYALAERLKELLDPAGEPWTIFDQLLIEKVAQDEAIALRIVRHLGDTPRMLEALGLHPEGISQSQDVIFEKMARCITLVATAGHAIIVGRGGALLCRDLPNCFHFRLVAGFDWRVKTYARRMEMPLDEAARIVKELSEMRTRFLSRNLGADITDARHYDAIFSNERHGVDDIAKAIVRYVRGAWSDRADVGKGKRDDARA